MNSLILAGILLLSSGTYLTRLSGILLPQYMNFTAVQKQILSDAATTLLFSTAVMSTLMNANEWAGYSRIAGVGVALILIWQNRSLLTIMLAAALTTSIARYAGFP